MAYVTTSIRMDADTKKAATGRNAICSLLNIAWKVLIVQAERLARRKIERYTARFDVTAMD